MSKLADSWRITPGESCAYVLTQVDGETNDDVTDWVLTEEQSNKFTDFIVSVCGSIS